MASLFKEIIVPGDGLLARPFGACFLVRYSGHGKGSLSAYALKALQQHTDYGKFTEMI